jgi:hypothetical protein
MYKKEKNTEQTGTRVTAHTRKGVIPARGRFGNDGDIPTRWLPVPAVAVADALVSATSVASDVFVPSRLLPVPATIPVRVPATLHATEYDDATRPVRVTVHDAAAGGPARWHVEAVRALARVTNTST